MKPVSTILGATLQGNAKTARAAAAELGGMFDAFGDAWRKGIEEWNTYLTRSDVTVRGVTSCQKSLTLCVFTIKSMELMVQKAYMNTPI